MISRATRLLIVVTLLVSLATPVWADFKGHHTPGAGDCNPAHRSLRPEALFLPRSILATIRINWSTVTAMSSI